jgi:hypothetical protein
MRRDVEEMIEAYSDIGNLSITRELISEDLLSWVRFKDGTSKIRRLRIQITTGSI